MVSARLVHGDLNFLGDLNLRVALLYYYRQQEDSRATPYEVPQYPHCRLLQAMAAISTIAVGRLYVAGASHQHEAAIAALQTVLSLPWKEARVEAANAVAYTTRNHPEWFWRGAQHTENGVQTSGTT